jgi:hypothetical protein
VRMLGDKQRVEAALFDRSGQCYWRDSFAGAERRNTEFYTFIGSYREDRIDARFLIDFHTSGVQGHRIKSEVDLRREVAGA